MRHTSRRLLALSIAAALLTGCQISTSDPFGHDRDGEYQSVKPEDRPPMEAMLARYRAFQADLFAQLDTRFGKRKWFEIPGSLGFDRAGCSHGELPDGEQILLGDMTFDGAYAVARWDEARDLVIKVGKSYGFTHITMIADKPGDNLTFYGHDRFGANYEFGMGINTTFGILTGCHRWNVTPSPSPTPTPAF